MTNAYYQILNDKFAQSDLIEGKDAAALIRDPAFISHQGNMTEMARGSWNGEWGGWLIIGWEEICH